MTVSIIFDRPCTHIKLVSVQEELLFFITSLLFLCSFYVGVTVPTQAPQISCQDKWASSPCFGRPLQSNWSCDFFLSNNCRCQGWTWWRCLHLSSLANFFLVFVRKVSVKHAHSASRLPEMLLCYIVEGWISTQLMFSKIFWLSKPNGIFVVS